MRGEPNDFWGKLEQDADGRVLGWNPVEAHCADVAACCEALLRDTLLGQRMARLLGRDALDPVLLERLVVLAALHDLGKYAISFQNRPYPDRQPQGGHVEPIVKALSQDGALRQCILTLLAPLNAFGESWPNYLAASISHHGRPEKIGNEGDGSAFDPTVFSPARGLDPLAGMRRLFTWTQTWCPRAFESTAASALLPESAAAQHFFAGIVMLGDWLGSDSKVFRYVDDYSDPMPQARERARGIVRDRFLAMESRRGETRVDFGVFDSGATKFVPRPAQSVLSALPLPPRDRGSLTVLEAETGSGKTEAAVHRFAQLLRAGLVDGLYFALPTRTSATQIHARLVRAVATTFSSLPEVERPPVVLAVPGYLRVDDETGKALPKFEFLWPDTDRGRNRHRTWAAENSKRYLAGSVVVGTVDQVLLSTLVVAHAHLRATALSRLFLVVDEVHASDAYMTTLLDQALAFHLACGGHALLMSATLGTVARQRYFTRTDRAAPLGVMARVTPMSLESAVTSAYPAVHHAVVGTQAQTIAVESPGNAKGCAFELAGDIDEPEAIASRALHAARLGAKVLVIRNTVADAVATQSALERLALPGDDALLFRVSGLRTLHHARFAEGDRKLLDDAIEAQLGKTAPRVAGLVVIATQTVQQSLDLDADYLITDLCPMDVLLQRVGRLHRHARAAEERPPIFQSARCSVLDPGSLAGFIDERGEVKSSHGFGSVYGDLRILEATRALLLERPAVRIPEDNRLLVERTTHPTALVQVTERDARFAAHATKSEMGMLVQKQLAQGHSVNRATAMGEYGFPSRETSGRITTRLGEEDRQVEFTEPFTSPFGSKVRVVKIPHWLARGFPMEVNGDAQTEGGVTRIRCLSEGRELARFVYDRLGLRAETGATATLSKEEDADE